MRRLLERALRAYEDWAEPRWSDVEIYVGRPQAGDYLILLRLERDGDVVPAQTIDLVAETRHRRSWFAPWRRYGFVVLVEPRSDRNVMWVMPAMTVSDPLGIDPPRDATVDEVRDLIINQTRTTLENPDPFFAPLSEEERALCS